MTTIAYCHNSRTIAADGRACLPDGMIISDTEAKLFTARNGDVIAAAGDVPLIEVVFELWPTYTMEDLASCEGMSMSAIIYDAERDVFIMYSLNTCGHTPPEVQWTLEYNYAIGSGDHYALAAMDHGANAVEAVKYAMTRDSGTGGEVTMFHVPEQEKGDE